MIKCWFLGHCWEHIENYVGKRITYNIFAKRSFEHDFKQEYYKCSRCGLYKRKTFIDHQLDETEYFDDCPLEKDK